MSQRRTFRLGNLQLKIMQVLWDRGPSTVADVQQALPEESELAYTTMATMLRKMETRGLVAHDAEGRRFVYRAAVEAGEVTRSMATDLLDRLFEGSLSDLVSHLLNSHEVSRDELTKLEALIAARKKQK